MKYKIHIPNQHFRWYYYIHTYMSLHKNGIVSSNTFKIINNLLMERKTIENAQCYIIDISFM